MLDFYLLGSGIYMRVDRLRQFVLSVALSCTTAANAEAAPLYRVTEMPQPVGAGASRAYALNDSGSVVGGMRYNLPNYQERPFLWSANAGVTMLQGDPRGQYGYGAGINNHGTVVGADSWGTASMWTSSTGYQNLGNFTSGRADLAGVATSINDAGTIVGWSYLEDPLTLAGTQRAFVWTQALGMRDLGAAGGTSFSVAYAINQHGDIVGTLLNSNTRLYGAALWKPDGTTIELGTLPSPIGGWAHAQGINDGGDVVGFSSSIEGQRAFLWSEESGMVNLGALAGYEHESVAYDINNRGQAVGNSRSNNGLQSAFFWSEADGMLNLSTLISPSDPFYGQLSFSRAHGINERGQIAASAPGDGILRAYLLTPVAVPEPGTISLFLGGIALLFSSLRSRSWRVADRS